MGIDENKFFTGVNFYSEKLCSDNLFPHSSFVMDSLFDCQALSVSISFNQWLQNKKGMSDFTIHSMIEKVS